MKIIALLSLLLSFPAFAHASENDHAYLDSSYTHLVHPKITTLAHKSESKNDTEAIIANQTPVRSQQSRGTCSIFSATAYLEGLLVQKGSFDSQLDLAEEWLQYTAVRKKSSDGSNAPTNFEAIRKFGMPNEETLPYIGVDWTETYSALKDARCAHLSGTALKSCHITHFDPKLLEQDDSAISDQDFVTARKEANSFRAKHITFRPQSYYLYDTADIKSKLVAGTPVILEINFYYGAWNHRTAPELGIERNMDHWYQGIVTNPEPGSLDWQKSPEKSAGHSILIVGFDDNKIIKNTIRMADGKKKTFTYKGVYYFKNSWGQENFGRDFELDGKSYPGYGMIVQTHAHNDGSFFLLPL